MIKTNQNMKENPPISFHIDQVQLQAFQTHLVDSKSFFFNDELSFIVRNNSPFYASIFDLMIQINGYQNIDEFRILSFNFSHSDSIGSNFQNTTSFTDFKIKMILLIQLLQSSFQDFTFKKIEISLDINQKIFFKHSRIQTQFFKKFELATIRLFKDLGYTFISTTIHKGVHTLDGNSSLIEQIGFNDNIKSISIRGGHLHNIVFTFCVYDKRFKHQSFSSDRNLSQWRFEITIHPKQMKRFFQHFKPTSHFFDVVQQFCTHFRMCDKHHHNHGINVLLQDIQNALQHAQF
jgi:hypothetical protein